MDSLIQGTSADHPLSQAHAQHTGHSLMHSFMYSLFPHVANDLEGKSDEKATARQCGESSHKKQGSREP